MVIGADQSGGRQAEIYRVAAVSVSHGMCLARGWLIKYDSSHVEARNMTVMEEVAF